MRRALYGLYAFSVTLFAFASTALATSYSGEGWYGETSDRTITYAMYVVIIFFPIVIALFSVIQWRLDKRKHTRLATTKRRSANIDSRGGW
ncbi:MAG: hypothetical protein ACJ764_10845 [Solirubrobacteraceae bacterium]